MGLKLINRFFITALFILGALSFFKYDLMPTFSENRVLTRLPTQIWAQFPQRIFKLYF